MTQNLLFSTDLAFGTAAIVSIERPSVLAGDTAFFYELHHEGLGLGAPTWMSSPALTPFPSDRAVLLPA